MGIFRSAIAAARAAAMLGKAKPVELPQRRQYLPLSCDCALVYYHGTSGDLPGVIRVPADGWWTKYVGVSPTTAERDENGKVVAHVIAKPGPSQSWRLFS